MTTVAIALPRLQIEEEFSPHLYIDTEGRRTIGYGFNLDAGISRAAALALLTAQANELDTALQAYPWYAALDPVRQSVCLDIAFNAGLNGLLRFPLMIAALTVKDWADAAAQCRVSNPELTSRYEKLANLLLTGEEEL